MSFRALAEGLAEVLKVAVSCLRRGDKQKVVVILSPKPPQAPIHTAFVSPADPGFNSPCDHLIERRVARQSVGQVARIVRVSAAQLNGSWRTIGLTVAYICGQEADGSVGNTEGWIEPA